MFEIHLWISCESHSLLRFLLLPPTYGKQKKWFGIVPPPFQNLPTPFMERKCPCSGGGAISAFLETSD